MIQRFTHFVTARPRLTLLLVLASMLFAGFLARDVRVDNNFAQLFATDGAASDFRETYRQQFGADDGVLVAVLQSEQRMDGRLVPLIERIGQRLLADSDVTRVYSITETSVQWRDADDALVIAPAFGEGSPFVGSFEERLRTVDGSLLGGNRLVSSDGRVFLVAAELRPAIDTYESLVGPAETFQATVQAEVDRAGLPITVSWAGIPFTRLGAISTMQGDLLFLAPLCTAVLALLLLVFLRRFLGMLVSLLCITVSTVLTAGVIGLAGDDLNQVTFIYPILLMVVVVANAVHFLQRYRVEREGGLDQAAAVRETTVHVTRASFLTSLTTAIGFASLYAAEMHVLRGFGTYLAAGVMMGFVVVSSVLPACLSLFGDRMVRVDLSSDVRALDGHEARVGVGARALERFLRFVTRRPVAIGTSVFGGVLLVGLLATAGGIVYDYRISDNVYADHPISVGNRLLDERMAGIVPVEVSLLGAPGQMDDPAILRRVDALGRWLEGHYDVARPISLASVVRQLSTELGGEDEVADDETTVTQLLFMADASPDRIVDQLVNADRSHTRLRSSTRDGGARYIVDMQTAVEAEAARLFAGTGVTVRMTGEAPVAYEGMNRLSRELVQSVAVALFFVVLAIGFAFRSVRVGLVSILPNTLPVAITLALYSLSGAVIDPLPGIAFCIGIGMSVDDTVHLLAGYRTLRARGLAAQEAAVQAVMELRGALVSSSVVLACGFFILMLSDFNMNQMMGLLGGTLIVLALICDLVFTPALLAVLPLHVAAADAHRERAAETDTDVNVDANADAEAYTDADGSPSSVQVAHLPALLGFLALLSGLPTADAQLPSGTSDPVRILRAARDRDGGERVSAQMRMTIRDAGGSERVRTMQTWALRFEGGVKTLAVFETPANIRDMGLLTVDHFDAQRDDEQWLYVPALRRTTRISTATRSGAFAGSDFSFADFTLPDPERYNARLLAGSVQVGDERAWHIELTPRDARTQRETGYTRVELWIGQRSLLALRTKAFTSRSGEVKYVQATGARQVNGVWMPRQVVARTLRGETLVSETVLEQVRVNVGDDAVNASLFTPARLERGL